MERIPKVYLIALILSTTLLIVGTGLARSDMRTLTRNEVEKLSGGVQGPWECGKGAIKDAPTGCASTPTSEDCAHRASCTGKQIINTYDGNIYYNDGTTGWSVSFSINECAKEYFCAPMYGGGCTYSEYATITPINKPTGYMQHQN